MCWDLYWPEGGEAVIIEAHGKWLSIKTMSGGSDVVEPIGVDDSRCCKHLSCLTLHQERGWCQRWYVLRWIADYDITFCMLAARLGTVLAPRPYAYWGKRFVPDNGDGDNHWIVEILLDMNPGRNTSRRRALTSSEVASLKERLQPLPGQQMQSFVAELYAFPCCQPRQKYDFEDWTNLVVRDDKREFWGANNRDLVDVFQKDVKPGGLLS